MQHYTYLADLFTYPEKEVLEKSVSKVNELLNEKYVECLGKIEDFKYFATTKSLDEQQEYYISTFDIDAACYLDIGYVLFGEDYKRGAFLVNMRNEHLKAGNDCRRELADYLPNMLRLLPKIEDRNFADELAYSIIIPALHEMLKNFKDEVNVYKNLLEILLQIMENDFTDLQYIQFKVLNNDKTNFLDSINCSECKK